MLTGAGPLRARPAVDDIINDTGEKRKVNKSLTDVIMRPMAGTEPDKNVDLVR